MYFSNIENCFYRLALLLLGCIVALVHSDIDYNTINDDGSYSFRHTNDDIGGFYHSASAGPDNTVRGRYGSRNPASGQVEETVYTAGPRGFRANGPRIHRKMDLAQYPPRRVGSPDDPLADPYDDPSYSFSYRTPDSSRTETNDATGRVRGLYSYLDDVGERHSVRYAAGAGTGFEVLNAVPDNPINVGYSAPLYKSHPKARGKMTVQRGPNGSYKLIAAGPDHRRAESRGPDGLVRGTYSYLDDKGIQRTVEYIAGAGIGYRIVQNSVGPGTHNNPSVSDFRLSDTDFRLANEFGRGAGGSLGSASGDAGVGNRRIGSASGSRGNTAGDGYERGGSVGSGDGRGNNALGGDDGVGDEDGSNARGSGGGSGVAGRGRGGGAGGGVGGGSEVRGPTGSRGSTNFRGSTNRIKSDRTGSTYGGGHEGGTDSNVGGEERLRGRTRYQDRNRGGSGSDGGGGGANTGTGGSGSTRTGSSTSSSASRHGGSGAGYNYDPPNSSNNYNFNEDDVAPLPPLITANRKILEIDRERDWVERNRDSTVIKNVGKWYIGLPPGQSVRAHVQNIDLLPLGGRRVPSPSEALRQDEIAEMVASFENGAGGGGGNSYAS